MNSFSSNLHHTYNKAVHLYIPSIRLYVTAEAIYVCTKNDKEMPITFCVKWVISAWHLLSLSTHKLSSVQYLRIIHLLSLWNIKLFNYLPGISDSNTQTSEQTGEVQYPQLSYKIYTYALCLKWSPVFYSTLAQWKPNTSYILMHGHRWLLDKQW